MLTTVKFSQTRCPPGELSLHNICLYCNASTSLAFWKLSFGNLSLSVFFETMSGKQIIAFLAGLGGLCATISATVSNEWKSTSRASSVITATWVFQGLWMNCAGNAIGAVHCRQHHTIFKLEGKFKAWCRFSSEYLLFQGVLFSV